MKLFISLLSLGTTVGGVFIGTLQQNLSKIKTEVDRLFEEIEGDIRKFSEDNPMTEKDAKEIKTDSSSSDSVNRKRRDAVDSNEKESKNTLGVWTDIWIQLLSNYIKKLWIGENTDLSSLSPDLESRNFSLEDKQKAVDEAEKAVENEKQKFEKKLDSAREKIEEIYKKMKKFLLIMELLKKYNTTDYEDIPYEEYVRKILEE